MAFTENPKCRWFWSVGQLSDDFSMVLAFPHDPKRELHPQQHILT
jgi:hypothetical protein